MTGSSPSDFKLRHYQFVDVEPEDGKPETSKKADAPAVKREPDAEALSPSVDSELPHAKPKPKRRQRK